MRTQVTILALVALFYGQLRADTWEPSFQVTDIHLFETSSRADIAPGDAPFLLSVHSSDLSGATCSAFFVANDSGKILIGTARHCFGYDEIKACESGQIKIQTFATEDWGTCARILVRDAKSDLFIFEADFGDRTEKVKLLAKGVVLAEVVEFSSAQYLQMYGFPSDSERSGRPTVSDNCWAFPQEYDKSWHRYYLNNRKAESRKADSRVVNNRSDGYRQALETIHKYQISIKHNCSTYGGNSGGPAVLKNTRVLLGLPITYEVNTAQTFNQNQYGLLETPNRLIQERRSLMRQFKIRTQAIRKQTSPPTRTDRI